MVYLYSTVIIFVVMFKIFNLLFCNFRLLLVLHSYFNRQIIHFTLLMLIYILRVSQIL